MTTRRHILLGAAGVLASPALARAQGPRTLRFIVPFAAGGSADIVARVLQPHLQERLRQIVIVENRPGAAGNTGMGEVAAGAPDGSIFALAPTNTLATNQFLFRNMTFDPVTAFRPVTLLCVLHNLLVVGAQVPADTPQAFIDWARRQTGGVAYGSSGVGTQAHLAAELLRRIGGFEATHVAYRNSTEPMTEMIRGGLAFMIAQEVAARPFLQNRSIKALGTAAMSRSRSSPDVPTLHEQGIANFEAFSWFALVLPAAAPDPVAAALGDAARASLALPEVRDTLAQQGVETAGWSEAETRALIGREIARWSRVIRDANITAG